MIQIGENLHFIAEASTDGGAQTRFYQFDCDFLTVKLVVTPGKINCAHSSVSNHAHDGVGANSSSYFRREGSIITRPQTCEVVCTFLNHVVVSVDLIGQQQLDFAPEVVIPRAR